MTTQIFYVSPHGDDSGAGTREQPFASLGRAREAVRAAVAGGAGRVEVALAPGEYRLRAPLRMDARDGAPEGGAIVWRGAGAGRTIVSGAVDLPPFAEAEPGLWRAPAGGMVFRQLYVNGRRAALARWPKAGQFFRISAWLPDTKEIIVNASDVPNATDSALELVVYMAWAEAILKLKSAARTAPEKLAWCTPMRLTFHEPEHSLVFQRSFPIRKPELPYFWQNSRAFLTEPGEWFLDQPSDTLYYRPLPGEELAASRAVAPALETLVEIRGTVDNPVRNVRFEGITFEGTTWLKPSVSGLLNLQAGMYTQEKTQDNIQYHGRPPAAVYAAYADGLAVAHCTFRHTGATALDVHRGVSRAAVTRCTFHTLAGAGINLGVFSEPDMAAHVPYNPADEREVTRDITIADTVIHHTGLDYPGTCAIAAGYVRDTLIEHNDIHDVPYTGISVGWGWTLKPNAMRNNCVRRNHIYRAVTTMRDGAGIYTLSSMPGSSIVENYVHDISTNPDGIGARNYGIYLDEGSDGITLENNLIQRIEHGNHHKINPSGTIVLKHEGAFDNPAVRGQAGVRRA